MYYRHIGTINGDTLIPVLVDCRSVHRNREIETEYDAATCTRKNKTIWNNVKETVDSNHFKFNVAA